MNNICVIIPYFGKWPSYLQLFLKSCSYNSKIIDYLIFTDNEFPLNSPFNVKFYKMTMENFNQLAKKKININISIDNAYKLCDFKPTYGVLFSEYINKYSYWGHGDLDLILGDLKSFLNDIINMNYEIISLRKEWISGSFCLYKNKNDINNLFLSSRSVPKIFLNDNHYSFTECMHLWNELLKGSNILDIDKNQSMTFIVNKKSKSGKLKYFHDTLIKESISPNDFVSFNNGCVFDSNNREYAFYHYITEKSKFSFFFPDWEIVPDKFYIDSTGFYTQREWNNILYKNILRIFRKVVGFIKFIRYYSKKLIFIN